MTTSFTTRVHHARQSILAGGLHSPTTMAAQRRERLVAILSHHYYNSYNDTYRRLLQHHGLAWGEPPKPSRTIFGPKSTTPPHLPLSATMSIEDILQQLPITDRALLHQGKYQDRPAVPHEQVAFTPISSGTTSEQPIAIAVSQRALWSVNGDLILAMLMLYDLDPATAHGYMVANFKRDELIKQPWVTYAVFSALSQASEDHIALGSIQDSVDQHFEQMLRVPTQWACTSPIFYNQLIARAGQRDLRQLGLQIILWGGMGQRPEEYESVMHAFGARHSVGFYVSTESNIAAFQIGDRLPYALIADRQIIEIVDEQGHHVKPGETGQILVTCLEQDATPIIRYRVGDQARFLGHFATDGQLWADLGITLPPPSWSSGGHIATNLVQHTIFFDQIARAGGLIIGNGRITYEEVALMQMEMAKRGTPVTALQLVKRRSAAGRDEVVVRIETSADQAAVYANALSVALLSRHLQTLLQTGELSQPTIEIFTPGTLGAGKFKIPPIVDETLEKTKAGLSIN